MSDSVPKYKSHEIKDMIQTVVRNMIHQVIKDEVTVEVEAAQGYYWRGFKVKLMLDGKEISSSDYSLEYERD